MTKTEEMSVQASSRNIACAWNLFSHGWVFELQISHFKLSTLKTKKIRTSQKRKMSQHMSQHTRRNANQHSTTETVMKNNVLDNVSLSTLRLFLILRTRRTTTTKTTISDNSQLQPWRTKNNNYTHRKNAKCRNHLSTNNACARNSSSEQTRKMSSVRKQTRNSKQNL